jgi:hypothetical protein
MDDNGEKKLTKQTGDVLVGQTWTADPGSLGVPDGSTVYMHPFVPFGTDIEARQAFVYRKGNVSVANYNITGHALGTDLTLVDVSWIHNLFFREHLALPLGQHGENVERGRCRH